MVHVKLMIVDDTFVSVGSGNFDNRSVRLNDAGKLNLVNPVQQAASVASPQL